MTALHEKQIELKPFGTLVLDASGTAASHLALTAAAQCKGFSVEQEILAIGLNYLADEAEQLAREVPAGIRCHYPASIPESLSLGFGQRPERARQTGADWIPEVHRIVDAIHHLSVARGGSAAVVVHFLSPLSGHGPVSEEAVERSRHRFPEALHVGVMPIPTEERALWPNFWAEPDYPERLGLPVVVFDNRHRQLGDLAISLALGGVIHGFRHLDARQPSHRDVFSALTREHNLAGVSLAQTVATVMKPPWWKPWGRPFLSARELPKVVGSAIADCLSREAKLVAVEEPSADSVQTLVVIVPLSDTSSLWKPPGLREEAIRIAKEKVNSWPHGLTIQWASAGDTPPKNGYVPVYAIRLFPVEEGISDLMARLIPRKGGT